MQSIRSVRELAGRYDAVLCDVWGVLHDGRTVFPGTGDALIGLRAAGVRVVLLTKRAPAQQHDAQGAGPAGFSRRRVGCDRDQRGRDPQ